MADDNDVHTGSARAAAALSAQMARLFAKALNEAIAPLDLAPAQYLVLRELWKTDSLTQSELTRRLEVEQATMANTLKRMARDDLVVHAPHPTDKRANYVKLTPRAAALEKPAKAAAKHINAQALAGLSRKEQRRFVELSRRIVEALKASTEAGRPDRPAPADLRPPPEQRDKSRFELS